MGTIHDDRTAFAAAGVVLLLDLLIAGQVLRFAAVPVLVDLPDGSQVRYAGGLTLGSVDDGLGADGRTVGVTVTARGLWPGMASRGVDPEGCPCTLSMWTEGTGGPVPVFRGRLTGCAWADPADPDALTATADVTPYGAGKLIPDALAIVGPHTWPVDPAFTVDPSVVGAYYPEIYGYPGTADSIFTPPINAPCGPALLVEYDGGAGAPNIKLVVANGRLSGGACGITDGVTGTRVSPVTVRITTDLLGRTVSYIKGGDFSGAFGGLILGNPYYTDTLGAKIGADGRGITTLGGMLLDLLLTSGLPVDVGRCTEQSGLLSTQVDACINAAVDPVAFIRAHVLPLFPVSLACSADGWYFYALRSNVAITDTVATFDADNGRVVRASSVQTSPWSEVVNAFRLRYRYDIRSDALTATTYVDGSDVAASFGLYSHVGSAAARWSQGQAWGLRSRELETRLVYRSEPAREVATGYVARNCAPTRRVVYTSGPEHLGIYPGAYVRLLDSRGGVPDAVMRVVGRSILPAASARGIRVAHTLASLGTLRTVRATS